MIDVWEDFNPVKECLVFAADIVDNGWCQGAANVNGRYCALGAISQAAINVRKQYGLINEYYIAADTMDTFREHLGQFEIVVWNDTPGRKKEEVSKALRDCAEGI